MVTAEEPDGPQPAGYAAAIGNRVAHQQAMAVSWWDPHGPPGHHHFHPHLRPSRSPSTDHRQRLGAAMVPRPTRRTPVAPGTGEGSPCGAVPRSHDERQLQLQRRLRRRHPRSPFADHEPALPLLLVGHHRYRPTQWRSAWAGQGPEAIVQSDPPLPSKPLRRSEKALADLLMPPLHWPAQPTLGLAWQAWPRPQPSKQLQLLPHVRRVTDGRACATAVHQTTPRAVVRGQGLLTPVQHQGQGHWL